MKKNLILALLSSLLAVSAFAGPRVGDSVTLDGKLGETPLSLNQTILSFDANTNVFVVQGMLTIDGQTEKSEENVSAESMMTEEMGSMIVTNCVAVGGTSETVTVKAGVFNSCKVLTDTDTYTWIAAVPFGMVRVEGVTPAGLLTAELSSVTRGQ